MDEHDELLRSGRRLLRFLDANNDGLLSVEECQHLKEDSWLFPSEDAFLAVLDPYDSEFLDADALWQLLSDRLEADPAQGEEWLKGQLPSVKRLYSMRRSQTKLMDSPKSARGSPSPMRSPLSSRSASRSASRNGFKPASLDVAWEEFCRALQVADINAAFSKLCSLLPTDLPESTSGTSVVLYEKLMARMPSVSIPRFERQKDSGGYPLHDAHLGVVGAGPIGLRAALELALLGAKVQVFDVRDGFYRMNVLKLWDWAAADLLDLGAKHLLPNFLTYIDHIGIRELQSLLLKLGLLAGVRYTWSASFKEVCASPSKKFLRVTTQRASLDSLGQRTLGAEETHSLSALVACDGGNSRVAAQLGLQRVRADGLTEEPGWEFAVVANFENLMEPDDRLLEECPRGFSEEELSLVKRLIYLQGETHYFIMTVEPEVLAEHGVLRNGSLKGKDLLSVENVDMKKLEDFARIVVEEYSKKVRSLGDIFSVEIPEDFWTTRAIALDPRGRPALSAFAYHANLTWLSQPIYLFDGFERELPVFFAGDALREPFWPYGEGCSRGFMGAFDTIWAVRSWAAGLRGEKLRSLRKKLFDLASKVDPVTKGKDVLLPYERPVPFAGLSFLRGFKQLSWPAWGFDGRKRPTSFDYTVDPTTRYRVYEDEEPNGRQASKVCFVVFDTAGFRLHDTMMVKTQIRRYKKSMQDVTSEDSACYLQELTVFAAVPCTGTVAYQPRPHNGEADIPPPGFDVINSARLRRAAVENLRFLQQRRDLSFVQSPNLRLETGALILSELLGQGLLLPERPLSVDADEASEPFHRALHELSARLPPGARIGFTARVSGLAGVAAAAYSAVRETLGPERFLWHGTAWECVPNIVRHGFNRAYAFNARHGSKLGRGVYFAEDPAYALRFAGRTQSSRALLLAGVLPGHFTRGKEGLLEPPRCDSSGKRFDATADDAQRPRVFCVFKDFQALPLYLIQVMVAS
ncbi:mical2b [Symbiodinium sp. CCMP2456]|nr:mical2b [Symbiodinium sp. CCMP2456]